jgi:large subunit ribosomal protein L6
MSRIGRMPVKVPQGVTVKIEEGSILVTGGKNQLRSPLPGGISARVDGEMVRLERTEETKRHRALHGLARALLANNVRGVTVGFTKELDIVGIGYRSQVTGRRLSLSLGYSHPVDYDIPDGIEIKVDKQTHLTISGADRHRVGQVAADLRRLRLPEPYKGKGIRYSNETIRRKAGKVGKTASA